MTQSWRHDYQRGRRCYRIQQMLNLLNKRYTGRWKAARCDALGIAGANRAQRITDRGAR
jgi:hypothetical protein